LTETFYVRLQKSCGDLTHLPVAVLIGPVTGSSGEFIAIGFSARQKTILIGEPTAGFTTANEGFELPGKDNGIVLAVSEAMDRNGNFYPNGVKPAITVSGDDFFHREADPKIKVAVKWLDKQQRSRKTRIK
jgi:C-terminal processing protease CtpA/Prc